jgi:hypothetical protein
VRDFYGGLKRTALRVAAVDLLTRFQPVLDDHVLGNGARLLVLSRLEPLLLVLLLYGLDLREDFAPAAGDVAGSLAAREQDAERLRLQGDYGRLSGSCFTASWRPGRPRDGCRWKA